MLPAYLSVGEEEGRRAGWSVGGSRISPLPPRPLGSRSSRAMAAVAPPPAPAPAPPAPAAAAAAAAAPAPAPATVPVADRILYFCAAGRQRFWLYEGFVCVVGVKGFALAASLGVKGFVFPWRLRRPVPCLVLFVCPSALFASIVQIHMFLPCFHCCLQATGDKKKHIFSMLL